MAIISDSRLILKTAFGDVNIPGFITDMGDAIPRATYKYLDIDSCFTRSSLENQYAYFSNPMEFNDPFDRIIPIAYHLLGENDEVFINYFSAKEKNRSPISTSEQINQKILEMLRMCRSDDTMKNFFTNIITAESRKNLDIMVSGLGVYSTSLIHDNILLWSHYANKHTGICLGINTYKLLTSLKCDGAMVKYEDYPIIVPFDEDDEDEVKNNIKPMFLSKAEFWKYEAEYRFSIFEFVERNQYFGNCIESLILGSEISAKNRAYAIMICNAINPDIEIYEAKKIDFTFKLEILKVIV